MLIIIPRVSRYYYKQCILLVKRPGWQLGRVMIGDSEASTKTSTIEVLLLCYTSPFCSVGVTKPLLSILSYQMTKIYKTQNLKVFLFC